MRSSRRVQRLVPLTTGDVWVRNLSGITVPDVSLQLFAKADAKCLDRCRGSLLFTHFGLSGPVVLDISRSFTALANPAGAKLVCDFLPEMPADRLDAILRRRQRPTASGSSSMFSPSICRGD